MLEMLTLLPPVLETVTVCAALLVPIVWGLNVNDVGLTETAAGLKPVPDRATLCGEPAAESLTRSVALRGPAAVGKKVSEAVQLAPAANDVPQLLVS